MYVVKSFGNRYLNRDFLIIAFQSPLIQNKFIEATRTLAQPTLNVSLIEKCIIPLPPSEEQHRIVVKVDELMGLCEELEKGLTLSRESLGKALKSVVNRVGRNGFDRF